MMGRRITWLLTICVLIGLAAGGAVWMRRVATQRRIARAEQQAAHAAARRAEEARAAYLEGTAAFAKAIEADNEFTRLEVGLEFEQEVLKKIKHMMMDLRWRKQQVAKYLGPYDQTYQGLLAEASGRVEKAEKAAEALPALRKQRDALLDDADRLLRQARMDPGTQEKAGLAHAWVMMYGAVLAPRPKYEEYGSGEREPPNSEELAREALGELAALGYAHRKTGGVVVNRAICSEVAFSANVSSCDESDGTRWLMKARDWEKDEYFAEVAETKGKAREVLAKRQIGSKPAWPFRASLAMDATAFDPEKRAAYLTYLVLVSFDPERAKEYLEMARERDPENGAYDMEDARMAYYAGEEYEVIREALERMASKPRFHREVLPLVPQEIKPALLEARRLRSVIGSLSRRPSFIKRVREMAPASAYRDSKRRTERLKRRVNCALALMRSNLMADHRAGGFLASRIVYASEFEKSRWPGEFRRWLAERRLALLKEGMERYDQATPEQRGFLLVKGDIELRHSWGSEDERNADYRMILHNPY